MKPTEEIDVTVLTRIVGKQAEDLWLKYDAIFGPINSVCPCRQSLWKDDFLKFARDRNVFKIIASHNGEVVGVAIATFDLYKIPWINPPVFWKPIELEGGTWDLTDRVMYVVDVGVIPEGRGLLAGTKIMQVIHRLVRENKGLAVGYDHSLTKNPEISKMIIGATGGRLVGFSPDKELDSQVYCRVVDAQGPAFN